MLELATVLISLGSLWVALIALRKSNAAQQRIVEIEDRREQDRLAESSQARLRPGLRKTGAHDYRLYLMNEGAAEARNVHVELDGKPLAEHTAYIGEAMPDLVGPQSEISCLVGLHSSCYPPFKVELTWDDESGDDRTYRTTLTL